MCAKYIVAQISLSRKANLVAAPGDLLIQLGAFPNPASGLTESLAIRNLEITHEFNVENGWMTVKPKDGAYWRARSVSRTTLGNFLRASVAQGRSTLDDQATYAANSAGEEYETIGPLLAKVALSQQDSGVLQDWDAVRLYGLMDGVQRSQLLSGKKFSISLLGPRQLAVVEHMVYGTFANLHFDSASDEPQDPGAGCAFYDGIIHEPTVCMPTGIPPGALLFATTTTGRQANAPPRASGDYLIESRALTAMELGWQMFAQSRPDLFSWTKEPLQSVKVDRLQFGVLTTIHITLKFLPLVVRPAELRDLKVASDQMLSFDQLPDDFKKDVEAAIAQYKMQFKNAKPGQYKAPPVGNNIPPAR